MAYEKTSNKLYELKWISEEAIESFKIERRAGDRLEDWIVKQAISKLKSINVAAGDILEILKCDLKGGRA